MKSNFFTQKGLLVSIAILSVVVFGLGYGLRVFASDGGSISLAPTQAELAAGQQLQLSPSVTDGSGKAVVNPAVAYRVEPSSLGTIDQKGLFTARRIGSGKIIGTEQDHMGSMQISINFPAAATSLDLWPVGRKLISDEYTISSDDAVVLEAIATDQYGNQWDATSDVTFSTNNPEAKFSEATFIPGKLGIFEIRAKLGDLVDTNTVTIEVGQLYRISVDLDAQKVSSDDRISMKATGYDVDEHDWDLTEEVTFSTTDPKGLVNDRVYQPGAVGTWKVNATLGAIVGSTDVVVNFGNASSVEILPKDQEVKPQGSVSYRVFVFDRNQNFVDVTSRASYTSDAGNFYGNRLDIGEISGNFEVGAEYKDLITKTSVVVTPTAAKETVVQNEQSLRSALDSFAGVEPQGIQEVASQDSIAPAASVIEEGPDQLASGARVSEPTAEEGEVLGVEDETVDTTTDEGTTPTTEAAVTTNTNTSISNTNISNTNQVPTGEKDSNDQKDGSSITGAWITIGIILALGLIGIGILGLIHRRG